MPSGDVTELSKLAAATGAAQDKLSLCANAISNVSIGQFKVTGISSVSITTSTPGYNQTLTAEMLFTGEGARFNRIKDLSVNPGANSGNFTWTIPAQLATTVNRGFLRTFRNDYFPGALSCNSSIPVTVQVKFYDQDFNNHIPNYNTFITTGVITLYSPPSPSVSPTGGTPPPRPCTGGGGCFGATYTISVNHGSYGGVTGTSSDIYLDGVLNGTTTGGSYTFSGLEGSKGYSTYSINNYGCQSTTQTFTTPAYV